MLDAKATGKECRAMRGDRATSASPTLSKACLCYSCWERMSRSDSYSCSCPAALAWRRKVPAIIIFGMVPPARVIPAGDGPQPSGKLRPRLPPTPARSCRSWQRASQHRSIITAPSAPWQSHSSAHSRWPRCRPPSPSATRRPTSSSPPPSACPRPLDHASRLTTPA